MIFISYRRDDCRHVAERVYDRLAAHFGKEAVFKDVDSIPLGRDFRQVIQSAVGNCEVLVAVIGPTWLTCSDENGRHRLQDLEDYVRLEIESALHRDIPVIPLLVDHAPMPRVADLPEGLKKLSFLNGIEVRPDPDFQNDMVRLISSCEEIVHADKTTESSEAKRRRSLLIAGGLSAILLLAIVVLVALLIYELPRITNRSTAVVMPTSQTPSNNSLGSNNNKNGSPEQPGPAQIVEFSPKTNRAQIDALLQETVGLVVSGFEILQMDGAKEEILLDLGTCFAITNDGYLLTSHHIIEKPDQQEKSRDIIAFAEKMHAKIAPKVWVFLTRDDKFEAETTDLSHSYDFAILKINRKSKYNFALSAQNAAEMPRGTPVAICAFGGYGIFKDDGEKALGSKSRYVEQLLTDKAFDSYLRKGTVNIRPHELDAKDGFKSALCIQHDAEMEGGGSGAPLIREDGTVIGINTYKLPSGADGAGSSYAISILQLRKEIEKYVPNTTWK